MPADPETAHLCLRQTAHLPAWGSSISSTGSPSAREGMVLTVPPPMRARVVRSGSWPGGCLGRAFVHSVGATGLASDAACRQLMDMRAQRILSDADLPALLVGLDLAPSGTA